MKKFDEIMKTLENLKKIIKENIVGREPITHAILIPINEEVKKSGERCIVNGNYDERNKETKIKRGKKNVWHDQGDIMAPTDYPESEWVWVDRVSK